MATRQDSSSEWRRAIAVGVLCALVPVLVLSANHGWLSWPIAVTGLLLILTAVCVIIFAPAASPSGHPEVEDSEERPPAAPRTPG